MDIKKIFGQFLAKYDNTFIEYYDSSNLNQCFDLVSQWFDYIGYKFLLPLGVLNAYQVWKLPKLTSYFDMIENTPSAIPKVGDVVVWSKSYNGGAGHIGIATGGGDTKFFDAFEQNDPLGSKSHVKSYPYTHVLGWLHDKRAEQDNTMEDRRLYWFDLLNKPIFNKPHEELTDAHIMAWVNQYPSERYRSGEWDLTVGPQGLNLHEDSNKVKHEEVLNLLNTLNKSISGKDSAITTAQRERDTTIVERDNVKAEIGRLQDQLLESTIVRESLEREAKRLNQKLSEQGKVIGGLQGGIQHLETENRELKKGLVQTVSILQFLKIKLRL